jgi:hypothetical protein
VSVNRAGPLGSGQAVRRLTLDQAPVSVAWLRLMRLVCELARADADPDGEAESFSSRGDCALDFSEADTTACQPGMLRQGDLGAPWLGHSLSGPS